jgi:hypothetical protein
MSRTSDRFPTLPKAPVVTTARPRVNLALESEVLTASVEEEVAHRRPRIGAVERDRPDHAERAPHGDGTGGDPSGADQDRGHPHPRRGAPMTVETFTVTMSTSDTY